ncbi:hypothetical protein B0D95_13190 [Cellvibrio sp. PSBB023]|nr:hypothetical protein B0D95_13190 [Cellvibrio sp. PSBB023]
MWHLFQDYQNTPPHIESLYLGAAIISSYLLALYSCKRRHLDTKKWPIVATCFGVMVAFLFGMIKFTFASTVAISFISTWLMVGKIDKMGL